MILGILLIVIPTLEKLRQKAKDCGLNISKVSENALEEMIACTEKPSQREQHENRSNDCLDSNSGGHARLFCFTRPSQTASSD